MTDESDDLNNRLMREFARRDKKSEPAAVRPSTELITNPKADEVPSMPSNPSSPKADVERDQMGMINRLRLRNAESAHQLERARLAYRTDMQLITHQSDAAIRESRAFWDAKSVEVAETIKTYVQATVRALEIDRLDSRNADIQRAYEVARQAGGIVFNLKGDVTEKTRARSAEADIGLLHTMLQWATTVRLPSGEFLLERNPLQGVKRIREKNKKQPVATWERYEATVAAMQKLRAESESDDDRLRWVRMEFALFLAERTGKRLGSIRQLRWEDFGVEKQVVSWRAEADKKGYSWQVPMPADFFGTVKLFQREIGAVGGYVFATPNTSDGIMDTSQLAKWLRVAEKKAKMPKLDGSLWHAYRRKWAIERKYLPLKDVAAAGGWKDVSTLLEVYQQSDAESVLAVTSVTLKLRDRGVA